MAESHVPARSADASPERPSRRGLPAAVRENGTLVAFAALVLFNAIVTPNFLALQTLYVNLSQVAPIAIVAIGMTLVIASGGIDLSVGSTMALAGAIAPFVFLSGFGAEHPGAGVALGIATLVFLVGGGVGSAVVGGFGELFGLDRSLLLLAVLPLAGSLALLPGIRAERARTP